MTNDSQSPPIWPFLLADGWLMGTAVLLWQWGHRPLLWWEAAGLIFCAAAGAGVLLTPFLLRSAHSRTLAQAQKLADAAAKIQKLEELANQISNSTEQWQAVQDGAAKTAQTASDLAQNMAAEARAFTEFLQKANDAEKAHLRLEAEKLRRSEGEWVEIVVRMLDQVYGLFQAAMQSGQPGLAEQIGLFQNACRDISRRAGLGAVTPLAGEPFDVKRHQLLQDAAAGANAVIQETLAPGYTYQGQMVRRALVRLQEGKKTNAK
ncbi:MAG TPA: nucleotide exchange factor GrpE [Candidatus Acidoferrum sp.]|nr:nucleotide exchange factor GrpE [Candidatus Acidoferrum sp.]